MSGFYINSLILTKDFILIRCEEGELGMFQLRKLGVDDDFTTTRRVFYSAVHLQYACKLTKNSNVKLSSEKYFSVKFSN